MAVKTVRLAILTAVLVGFIAAVRLLPVVPLLMNLFGAMGDRGLRGAVALGSLYILSCLFLIPGLIPTLAAGFLFGVLAGSLTAIAGSTVGAWGAFLLGRSVARGWVVGRIARNARLAALDDAIGAHGFLVVLLSRLSPISPFVIMNYLLALTKVSFWEYTWGTLLGAVPGTVMFVYFGAGLRSLADVMAYARGEHPATRVYRLLLGASLVVAVVVTILLTRMAREVLRKVAPALAAPSDTAPTR